MQTDRILVATDLSAEAAWAEERGAMLARSAGARLDLVHVVADTLLAAWRAAMLGQDSDVLLSDARQQLSRATQRLRDDVQIDVESQVVTGTPHRAVLDTADRLGSRLIVVGAHGRHPLHTLILGSVTEKLLYRTERPLLITKRQPREGYGHVLAAVDFSPPAAAAVRLASELAAGAAFTLYHAVESPFEGMLRIAGVEREKVEAHRRETIQDAEREMQRFVTTCGLPSSLAARRVEYGYPTALIEAALQSHGPDLLVLGKHGRSAVERWMVGSVTAHMTRVAQCDVLVVPMSDGAVQSG